MCSIAGIINHAGRDRLAVVERMNLIQCHRGPDAAGVWQDERALLGHRRLSIIDLAGGRQPMAAENAVIVFNGEIYNHRQLRGELEQRGHTFRSASDTEVVLHCYLEYGERLVEKLQGMFALGLWDPVRRRLLLVRDRVGQKPLFYFRHGDELVFASEIAALRQHPEFPDELDPGAISDFLSLQYIPPHRCAYAQVKKLPPGSILTFDADSGESVICPYWRVDFSVKNTAITFDQAAEETRRLVTEAVRKRLMADVPSGVFLSGGLDSAIISGLAAQLRRPERTAAFTVTFAEKAYDEQAAAELSGSFIARQTGGALECFQRRVGLADFELLKKLLVRCGEPFADASILPTYLLAEFAREKITMALSGDGADEVFGGYERYAAMDLARFLRLPRPCFALLANCFPDRGERTRSGRLRRFLKMLDESSLRRYFALLDRCPPELKLRLFGEQLEEAVFFDSAAALELPAPTAADRIERCLENDLERYLPGDILPKVDTASMAASLEVRNPFLDHELIEFAATLPRHFKLCGRSRKHVLKAAFADAVPPEIRHGRKRGFGVPVGDYLRRQWNAPARELLFDGKLIAESWIAERPLNRLWALHCAGKRDYSYLLFNLVALSLFLDEQ